MAKRRVAMALPLVAVIAPILILFIAAAIPSIVFGLTHNHRKGTAHDPDPSPQASWRRCAAAAQTPTPKPAKRSPKS